MKNPLPQNLGAECRKCAKILNQFIKPGISGKGMPTDQFIPWDILHKARGIAILTVVKAGFMWAGKAGSGLVIARLPDGGWSAPSAIGTAGMSFGGQIGAEVTDFVIVLNTEAAVKAFSHGGNVTLGGGLSVAAGPYGRTAEASATAKNMAAVYSYSKSKGLFAGISIEGSVILERKDANEKFYGRPVKAKELLSGTVPAPALANDLYAALDLATTVPSSAEPSIAGETTSVTSLPTPISTPATKPLAGPPPAGVTISGSGVPTLSGTGVPTLSSASPAHSAIDHRPSLASVASPAVSAIDTTANKRPSMIVASQSSISSRPSSSIVVPPAAVGVSPATPPTVAPRPETAVALFDFEAQQEGDLGFRKGDMITVLKRGTTQDEWWFGRCQGREGSFPANYCSLSGTNARTRGSLASSMSFH
ncbi:hypothetical protein AMAG_16641 [Allomyces macrogynus ATCC 38327]|uniref:SH3 domain-containing protein n=1 Tax=Allomyces macrogynus (strain ATCC 38327) TaxID=578462 RepID=A0A0L0TBS6_ALLM3|nr:hypothetical protein AMAG_16641 [Allomyces macrogynus ATCC 38327]|eukprot:KNE72150.1 hypothetical protein AMAG_16641 [Allomyces macrogynus ATCC 38327]